MKAKHILLAAGLAIGSLAAALGQASSGNAPAALPPPPPPLAAPAVQARVTNAPLGFATPVPRFETFPQATQAIWLSEEQMNHYYVNRFIQSAGFGGVRMTVPTMELDPSLHLVLAHPVKLDGPQITAIEGFRVEQLELIGIAKHDTPVAFVVNRHSGFIVNRPQQTKPGYFSAPLTVSGTRPLTDFEKAALDAIKAGKEVADLPQADGSRLVVGALRAQAACLECHDAYQAGDALGAFSYRLVRDDVFSTNLISSSNQNASATAPNAR